MRFFAFGQIDYRALYPFALALRQIKRSSVRRRRVICLTEIQCHACSACAAHAQSLGGGFTHIDDVWTRLGATVVDSNPDLTAVGHIDHTQPSAQWQSQVRSRQGMSIKPLATGRATPMPTLTTVPCRPTVEHRVGRGHGLLIDFRRLPYGLQIAGMCLVQRQDSAAHRQAQR